MPMDPATGQPDDVHGPEPAGGLVGQQDTAAATAPMFVGPPGNDQAPAPAPPLPVPPIPDQGVVPAPMPGDENLPPVSVGVEPGSVSVGVPAGPPAPDAVVAPPAAPAMAGPSAPAGIGVTPPAPGASADETSKPLVDQRIDAAKREGEVRTQLAKIEAEKAETDLKQKVAAKDEEDKIISRAEQQVADGRARRQAEYDKYRDMSVQDAWGDNGVAKRVLAGIAMILGGRAGATVVIGAAQGLAEKKKTELALQEKVMANAGKSLDEIKDQTTEEMVNFKNRQAAALAVTAARLEQEKRAQGIPESAIENDQQVIEIKAAAEKAEREKKKLEMDAANERLKMGLTQAQTRQANAHADLYERTHGKPAKGAGGGGGGASLADHAKAVADAITEGAENPDGTRRELTYGEKVAVAKANGIKPNGKPSETTLDTINKSITFDAKAATSKAAAAKRMGLGDEKQLNKEASEWAKTNGVDAIAKTQRELNNLKKVLADNPDNPTAQALAIEKAVSAARGGAASKQALALALDHMGGSLDKAEGFIQNVRSGAVGKKQMENFMGFLNGQLGSAQKEGKDAYDSYQKYVDSQPENKRQGLISERGRIFSGLHGFGGKDAGAGTPQTKTERIRAIVSDPSKQALYTPTQWKALQAAASMGN